MTIRDVKNTLAEHHKKYGGTLRFMEAVSLLEKSGYQFENAPRLPARKDPRHMNDRQFEEYMLNMPIIFPDNARLHQGDVISESTVIPYGKDIYAYQHLPYVDDGIHKQNCLELNYVYRGHCRQIITNEERTMNEGEFCVISPFTPHSVIVDSDSFIISIMVRKSTFDAIFGYFMVKDDLLAAFFKNTLYETVQSNYLLFHTDNNEDIRMLIRNIAIESNNSDNYSSILRNSYLQVLFCTLLRHYSETIQYYGYDKKKTAENDFTLILEYMNQHYDTVTLDYLAGFFHYSTAYLSKLFRKNMKSNYCTILQNIRLRHAEEYLLDSDLTIQELSQKVGYDSVDYFTKRFKSRYNCTPSYYRKKHRAPK